MWSQHGEHLSRRIPRRSISFSLTGELAARAAFLARVHHRSDVEDWLRQVIRERIELEEIAFAEAKRDTATRATSRAPAASRRGASQRR